MANTNTTATSKKRPTTVSPEDSQALADLRDMLDQRSDEALAQNKPYIAGILTELLAHIDKEVNRVNRYAKRISVAAKRDKVRQLRKAINGAQTGADKSQAS